MDQARTKLKLIIASVVVAVAAVGGGTWAYLAHVSAGQVQTVTNNQQLLTQISYHGQNGVDALTLLKQHATVQVKHYSFGDLVTSINGSAGNGSKYWTFYVNSKQSQVGAADYKTKESDTLSWKLQ